jgi:hypothetical protein
LGTEKVLSRNITNRCDSGLRTKREGSFCTLKGQQTPGHRMTAETMQSLIWVFVVSVVLNYLWELAQAPFYVGMENYNIGVLWHCFVASLGDGLMVLLIVTVGWIYFQR